ncbi:hypothetical protein Franean1_7143 [Parafrankia sp. EAN1pec]|nr:hypothetical protein Franean1_7143 [Frankia sp. EAN1pec]
MSRLAGLGWRGFRARARLPAPAPRRRRALLRLLLPRGDRAKDIEIVTLRHQITVLQRQLDGATDSVPARRPCLARRTPAYVAAANPAPPAATGPPGDFSALAPRPNHPPPRRRLPSQTARSAPHCPLDPRSSQALYTRLGFEVVRIEDPRMSMQWTPGNA